MNAKVVTGKTQRQVADRRLRVLDFKVDYIDRPLGLDNPNPRLSWRMASAERNARQTAYRILVASNETLLEAGQGDLWDTGRVESSECLCIPYRGKALQSRQRCFWRVQIWDASGQASDPSDASGWEMGLLSPADWTAQWLAVEDAASTADRAMPLQWMWGPDPQSGAGQRWFRLRFSLPAPIRGGVLLAQGRSYEKITQIWIDDIPLGEKYPAHDLTRESVSLGQLPAGSHQILIQAQGKCPWPEVVVEPPPPSIAMFARFDGKDASAIRLASGQEWQTSTDRETWTAVCTSPVETVITADAAMHLRREFSAARPVVSARLYITALGCYEARLNGQRIGDALLTPEIAQYEKRVRYQVYDVTPLIQKGGNVIGLTVGDGWYGSHPGRYAWAPPPRRVLAQLELTYADGTRQTIATGPDWRIARSPIQQSALCIGEIHDARRELPGWDAAGFDDSGWQEAEAAPGPPGLLTAQVSPPIRATEVLRPQTIHEPLPGVHVFDFGQNFSGWCRLRLKGSTGTRVDLRFAEQIHPSGEIDQFSLNGGKAVDTYFLRGDAQGEAFEPCFVYHGFRYVQVTGLPNPPTTDTLEGIVIHSDFPMTGTLRADHPLIEPLWRALVWTQRSNTVGIMTDCNGRSERMAYLASNAVRWDAATFNMDLTSLARWQMDSSRDHQYSKGAFAPLAPSPSHFAGVYRAEDETATPGGADGALGLTWMSWRRYADRQLLEDNWEAMDRYLTFILERNPDYQWLKGRGPEYGDWLALGEDHMMHKEIPPTTPLDLLAQAYWACSAGQLSQIAAVLDRAADVERLRAVRARVRERFIERFVDAEGRVGNGSQTSYVLALQFDLVPEALRARALEHLVEEIRGRGLALSTGIFGTQFILDVLADGGYADVAVSLLLRTEYPSWGYMLKNGATTLWERWDGCLERHRLTAAQNHMDFGSVGGFLFRRLAGIEEIEPGFKKIRVRPLLDPRITKGGGDYHSVMGRISTDWQQMRDGSFLLEVSLPANTTAQVHLPAQPHSRIEERGEAILDSSDVQILHRSDSECIVAVGSGSYRFTVAAPMAL